MDQLVPEGVGDLRGAVAVAPVRRPSEVAPAPTWGESTQSVNAGTPAATKKAWSWSIALRHAVGPDVLVDDGAGDPGQLRTASAATFDR